MAALSVAASAVHAAPRAASLGSVRARCPAKTRGALRAAPARATRARDVGVRAVQEVAGADFQAEVLDVRSTATPRPLAPPPRRRGERAPRPRARRHASVVVPPNRSKAHERRACRTPSSSRAQPRDPRERRPSPDPFSPPGVPSQSDVPVLVDFWATWCGPCKLISKVVEKAADEYPADKLKIVKIEVDPNPELVEKYEVYGLPTIVLFKDGEVVSGSKREGAINLPKLKDHLATHGVEAA